MNQEVARCLDRVDGDNVHKEESLNYTDSWDTCDPNLCQDDVPIWSQSSGSSIPHFLEGSMTRRKDSSVTSPQISSRLPQSIKSYRDGIVFVKCKDFTSEEQNTFTLSDFEVSEQLTLGSEFGSGKDVTSQEVSPVSTLHEKSRHNVTCNFGANRHIRNCYFSYDDNSNQIKVASVPYNGEEQFNHRKELSVEVKTMLEKSQKEAWDSLVKPHHSNSFTRKISSTSSFFSAARNCSINK